MIESNLGPVFDSSALLEALRATDIRVPPPGPLRTKMHMERWTAYRLLSSLVATDRLSFPLSLDKRERPDFSLSNGGTEIGLEITEATHPEYKKLRAFGEKERDEYWVDPSLFRRDMHRLKRKDMLEILDSDRLTGPGWQGCEPEILWAEYASDAILDKMDRLRSDDFKLHQKNWLAIYANAPICAVKMEDTVRILSAGLSNIWELKPCFDLISIEQGSSIALISESESRIFPLNDVWTKSASR